MHLKYLQIFAVMLVVLHFTFAEVSNGNYYLHSNTSPIFELLTLRDLFSIDETNNNAAQAPGVDTLAGGCKSDADCAPDCKKSGYKTGVCQIKKGYGTCKCFK